MSTTKVTDSVRDTTAVDAAKITTGTIPEARITTLDATKLTGSIASARIPAGAVTQHVQATDLTSVHQGIATLGLHMGVADNKVAFNLPNSFIDVFQDSSGVTTTTDVSVNASEYVSSVIASSTTVAPAYFTGNQQSVVTMTSNANIYNYTGSPNTALGFDQLFDGDTTSISSVHSFVFGTGTQPASGKYLRFQFASPAKLITEAKLYVGSTEGLGTWQWQGSNDGSAWTTIGNTFTLGATAGGQALTELSGNTNYYTWYQMIGSAGTISDYPYVKEIEFKRGQIDTTSATNATGTLISDAQTAAGSTTEVSGVILYTDNAGTNTLGTDLKIYFTANNGGAWTEATSYGASQVFSGSIKQVKLGKTTVTAGTQIAIKAVWANQSASKIAHLEGWAVNY